MPHNFYDGMGIIIRKTYENGIRCCPNFGSVRTVNFTCGVYTGGGLHGCVFPDCATVLPLLVTNDI